MVKSAGSAKLKTEDVLAIRAESAAGPVNQRELARRYGVKASTIGDIIFRRTWRHI